MKKRQAAFFAASVVVLVLVSIVASVAIVSAFWPFSTTGKVTDDYNTGANVLVSSVKSYDGVSQFDKFEVDNRVYSKAVSVTGWFKTAALRTGNNEITGSWVSKRDSFILDPESDGSVKFWVFVDGVWHSVSSAPNKLPLNQWDHWAGTWDGKTLSIYRGGILEASTQVSGTLGTSGSVCVGHDCGLSAPYDNRYYYGSMTDVRVYADALSGQAISDLYRESKKKLSTSSTPTGSASTAPVGTGGVGGGQGSSTSTGGSGGKSCIEYGDTGKDPDVAGTIVCGDKKYGDECYSSNTVLEYYYDEGIDDYGSVYLNCAAGKTCQNGRCVGSGENQKSNNENGGGSGGQGNPTQTKGDRYAHLGLILGGTLRNTNRGDSLIISPNDIEGFLATGIYENSQGRYAYQQSITLGDALRLEFFSDSDYYNKKPTIGINLSATTDVLNYTLSFPIEAIIERGSTLRLLGADYSVLYYDDVTPRMILLEQATLNAVKEAEKKIITVNGKNYEVSINFISADKVKLSVNGETTGSLTYGDAWKLYDGMYIGVRDILKQDVAGTIGKVEFSFSTNKLEIDDKRSVRINDKSYGDIVGYINRGTGGSRSFSSIVLQWKTNDKTFITQEKPLVMPGFSALEFSMGRFTQNDPEKTIIHSDGNYVLQLTTTIKDGLVTIPLLYSNASGAFIGIGKGPSNRLATKGRGVDGRVLFNYTGGDKMIVVSSEDANAESYLVRFNSYTAGDTANMVMVEYWSNGQWLSKGDKKAGDIVTFGSISLTIDEVYIRSGSKWVYLKSPTAVFDKLYTKEGLKISLPYWDRYLYGEIGEAGSMWKSPLSYWDEYHISLTSPDSSRDYIYPSSSYVSLVLGSGGDGSNRYVDVARVLINEQLNRGNTYIDPVDSNNRISMTYGPTPMEIRHIGPTSSSRTVQILYSRKPISTYVNLISKAKSSSDLGGSGQGSSTSVGGGGGGGQGSSTSVGGGSGDGKGFCANGCSLASSDGSGKCLPFGTRAGKDFCALTGAMVTQKATAEKCDNGWECKSNVCASGQCVDAGLFQKMIDFFKKLFGG